MPCNKGSGHKHSSLLSAAVQGSFTAGLCQCNCTYGDLLFIQGCSVSTPVPRNTGSGEKHSPLLSAAVQDDSQQVCVSSIAPVEICSSNTRQTASLWDCQYNCESWLYVWSAVAQHQCTAAFGNIHSPRFLWQLCEASKLALPVSSGIQEKRSDVAKKKKKRVFTCFSQPTSLIACATQWQ